MPHMAKYDSWKLADVMTAGLKAHCTVMEKHRMFTGLAFLPVMMAVSLSVMNRNALMIDGEEPVMTE